MNNNTATLQHKLIVPAHQVPLNALDHFKVTLKNEEGELVDYVYYYLDYQQNMYYFDRGDLGLIYKVFSYLKIEDQRSAPSMNCLSTVTNSGLGLVFTGKLRQNQQPVADYLINGLGYGQLKAHPRFGKTVVMTAVTCKLGLKTLFLSHEISLAKQAYEKFTMYTNCLELEKTLGRKVVGIVDKWEDMLELDVCIMPYQKFVSGKNSKEWLLRLRNQFGLIFVDESHKSRSDTYAFTVSSFNPKYRYGVSGTTELKNNMHLLNHHILGPVVVTGHGDQLPFSVITYNTNVSVPIRPSKMFFTMALTYLAGHNERNKFILSIIEMWLKAGHTIIATSDRTAQCDWFAAQFKELGYTAESYHAKKFKNQKQREEVLQRIRDGKTQAMFAMRSMVLGLDIPRATAFFNMMPTAHPQNYYQEFCRVRTPFSESGLEKTHSWVIDFRDDNFILKACYKTRRRKYVEENVADIQDDLSDEPQRGYNGMQ